MCECGISDCQMLELAAAGDPRATIDAEETEREILRGIYTLTNKLYQYLARKPGNIFFSPLSLHAVLSMAYQGAREDTAVVLADVLNLPNADRTAVGYNAVLSNFEHIQKVRLHMGNKIYVKEGMIISELFSYTLQDYFHSEVEVVDFEQKQETSRLMNKWVAERNHQKIRNIVDEENLNEHMGMVLISTIYFRAKWRNRFVRICRSDFYLSEGGVMQATMLRGRIDGLYKQDDELEADILSIRFKKPRTRMVIILPRKRDGLPHLEAKLSAEKLAQVTENLVETTVNLSLPKFRFEALLDFEEELKEIGLRDIFNNDTANFDGIFKYVAHRDRCLGVAKVIQKAVFFVKDNLDPEDFPDEEDLLGNDKDFFVDHPAFFMVTECDIPENTTILFAGRIFKPEL